LPGIDIAKFDVDEETAKFKSISDAVVDTLKESDKALEESKNRIDKTAQEEIAIIEAQRDRMTKVRDDVIDDIW